MIKADRAHTESLRHAPPPKQFERPIQGSSSPSDSHGKHPSSNAADCQTDAGSMPPKESFSGVHVPSQSSCSNPRTKSYLLGICREVVGLLRGEELDGVTNACALQQHDIPVRELDGKTMSPDYMGCCLSVHGRWTTISSFAKVALENRCEAILVKLTDESGNLFSIEQVISTVLHEVAHVVTPGQLSRFDENGTGKKTRKWHYHAHSALFFQNYSMIMQVAERIGIFLLPPQPNKFSQRCLERLDKMSMASPIANIGYSPRYSSSNISQPTPSPTNLIRVRFQLRSSRRPVQKLALIHKENMNLDVLEETASSKLNLRSRHRVCLWLPTGAKVDETDVAHLDQNALLFVSKTSSSGR